MKNIVLASLVSFLSVAAMACPNLSGNFVCPADQNSAASVNTMTQTADHGVTTYMSVEKDMNGTVLSSDNAIADGVTRQVQNGDGGTIPMTFTCEGDVALRLDTSFSDVNAGPVTVVARMSINAQGNLLTVTDATVGNYGPQHQERICTRQ